LARSSFLFVQIFVNASCLHLTLLWRRRRRRQQLQQSIGETVSPMRHTQREFSDELTLFKTEKQ